MIKFIVGLCGIWFVWKCVLFVWHVAEGIDHELEDRKGGILRPYHGPIMRDIQPKKEKRLFGKR
jgi:hypothetical protein